MTLNTTPQSSGIDWGAGAYERTAARLAPAADVLVARAGLRPGDRVADIGCGTGSVALRAAAAGADVVGVDPAPRLLEVARREAGAAPVRFVHGDAEALPLADDSIDVALSSFGLIFATDPTAAAAELARVVVPGGRLLFTAWRPEGAIFDYLGVVQRAVSAVLPPHPAATRMPWHDREAVGALLAAHDFAVEAHDESITFTAPSPEAYLMEDLQSHPAAVAGAAVLGSAGTLDSTRDAALSVLRAGNEDPAAFKVTSRYVVVSARRPRRASA